MIGLEAKAQMELAGDRPDVVIGCVGGGSNYAGLAYPFMADRLSGATPDMRFLATEPAACPTLTKGASRTTSATPADDAPRPMYTLGHTFVPAPVHAGGLRYHGDSPSLSLLVKHGHMEAVAYSQNDVFDAAVQFAQTEGIVPARAGHAVRGAIDEAIAAREAGEERVILFNLSGHGAFDMQAYDDYLNGRLPEVEYREEDVAASMEQVPDVPIPEGRARRSPRRSRRQPELLDGELGDLPRDDRVPGRVEVQAVPFADQRHAAALAEVGV